MNLDYFLNRLIDNDKDELANQEVLIWIIQDFESKGIRPTEEEILDKYKLLITDSILEKLSTQGLVDPYIDEHGEVSFKISGAGQKALQECPYKYDI